jgi:hypothetical protein
MVLVVALLAAGRAEVAAQYNEPRDYEPSVSRFLALGVGFRDFAPRPANPAPDSTVIRYNVPMPLLTFRQGPVDIQFGYTRYTLQGASREAIYAGTMVSTDLVLTGDRWNALVVPLAVAADYTKSEGTGPERETFNVGSIGIGAGLKYHVRTGSLDLFVRATGIIHYSFEGVSTGSGSSAALDAEAGILLFRIPVFDGLAAGYRFRTQTWTMSDDRLEYRAVTHGPYVGVIF